MDPQGSHLVVLCHGVAGLASDLGYLASLLAACPQLVVLAPRCNEPLLKPFEGVVAGGERIVAAIQEEMARQPALRKLSLVGHSLGGLYARYAAGVLYGRYGCVLEPVNLITIATPHLGVRRPTGRSLLRGGGFNGLFNLVAERLCSQLGLELSLEDEQQEPLLVQLCKGPFLLALRRFACRCLYANVFHDFLVPFCTASILPRNPYRRGELPLVRSPLYPHITLVSLYRLELARSRPTVAPAVDPAHFAHGGARELAPPGHGPPALARALTPLSTGAHRLDAAIDEASACAVHAGGAVPAPRFSRSVSAPASPEGALLERRSQPAHGARPAPQLGMPLTRTASSFFAPLVDAGGSARALSWLRAAPLSQHAGSRRVAESEREGEDEIESEGAREGKGGGECGGGRCSEESEPSQPLGGGSVGPRRGDPPADALREAETLPARAGCAGRAAGAGAAGPSAAELRSATVALEAAQARGGASLRLRLLSQGAGTEGWDKSFGSEGCAKRAHMLHMLFCLNSVPWERVDCVFNSPAAHEQIVNKNAWTSQIGIDTGDVCRHIYDDFRL